VPDSAIGDSLAVVQALSRPSAPLGRQTLVTQGQSCAPLGSQPLVTRVQCSDCSDNLPQRQASQQQAHQRQRRRPNWWPPNPALAAGHNHGRSRSCRRGLTAQPRLWPQRQPPQLQPLCLAEQQPWPASAATASIAATVRPKPAPLVAVGAAAELPIAACFQRSRGGQSR